MVAESLVDPIDVGIEMGIFSAGEGIDVLLAIFCKLSLPFVEESLVHGPGVSGAVDKLGFVGHVGEDVGSS